MPRTVYATTRATYHDTKFIAKAKWLQQLQSPSSAAAGILAEPTSPNPQFHDTKLISLQKILTQLQ